MSSVGPQCGADAGELSVDRLGGELVSQHGVDVGEGLGVEVDVVAVEARRLEGALGGGFDATVPLAYGLGEGVFEGDALGRVVRRVHVRDVVGDGTLTKRETIERTAQGSGADRFKHGYLFRRQVL